MTDQEFFLDSMQLVADRAKALAIRRTYIHRENEMYGTWLVETEKERALRVLAETYHIGCDAYDQRVCSGLSCSGREAIPMTSHEARLSNRHAREMRATTIADGLRMGFTASEVEEAIRKWVK